MAWDHFMMFTIDLRRYPHVRTALSGSFIAQTLKRPLQALSRHITWQFHGARTSSRTK